MLFDRIAAVLVACWFVAGLWLVVQAALLPRPLRPAGDTDGE